MPHSKIQVILSNCFSILFIFWVYVASPLMTISIMGGFGVKAKSPAAKINICHETESLSNPWNVQQVAADSTLTGREFLYTGPVDSDNKPTAEGDAWCATQAAIIYNHAPVIASHSTIIENSTNPAGKTVTFTNPTATDSGDTAGVVCLPNSGSNFPVGNTTVTCTATDSHGATDIKTFTVTINLELVVQLNTPPQINSHENVTVHTTNGSGVAVNFSNPTE